MNIMETIKNVKPLELMQNPKVKNGLTIGLAALFAVISTKGDIAKEATINDLVDRVNKLEGK